MKVLVIDVGGTHVKVLATGRKKPVKIDSGPAFTAAAMVRAVKKATRGWSYDAVAIGFPGIVVHGRPLQEPHNLGRGWVGFDFARAFGKPVRMANDAAMQALGSYEGGRMLFLGLGTGLGAAMIDDGHVEAMEIAHLPCRKGKTYEDLLGIRALKHRGRARWERQVHRIASELRAALVCDYVVIGGGNAKRLTRHPAGERPGNNANAFLGGYRLWRDARVPGARTRATRPRVRGPTRRRSRS